MRNQFIWVNSCSNYLYSLSPIRSHKEHTLTNKKCCHLMCLMFLPTEAHLIFKDRFLLEIDKILECNKF